MTIAEWFIDFGWFGFHPITVIFLMPVFLYVLYKTRACGIYSLIFSFGAVAMSIHIYELCHGSTLFSVKGYAGPTWMNTVILLVIAFYFMVLNQRYNVITKNITIPLIIFFFLILSFWWLRSCGFFNDYPYSITRGPEWMSTKVIVSVFIMSLFKEGKNVSLS